jgi:hypothetical protein
VTTSTRPLLTFVNTFETARLACNARRIGGDEATLTWINGHPAI